MGCGDERLRGVELPPRSSIDLLLSLKQLGDVPFQEEVSRGAASSDSAGNELAAFWKNTYPVCVEISSWTTPLALPLQLMLRRCGCSCLVVVNPPLQQRQQQVTREMLEASTLRSGTLLAVREIDVIAAFAAGEQVESLKRVRLQITVPCRVCVAWLCQRHQLCAECSSLLRYSTLRAIKGFCFAHAVYTRGFAAEAARWGGPIGVPRHYRRPALATKCYIKSRRRGTHRPRSEERQGG